MNRESLQGLLNEIDTDMGKLSMILRLVLEIMTGPSIFPGIGGLGSGITPGSPGSAMGSSPSPGSSEPIVVVVSPPDASSTPQAVLARAMTKRTVNFLIAR